MYLILTISVRTVGRCGGLRPDWLAIYEVTTSVYVILASMADDDE